jgi:hypothetical protein
MKITIVIPKEIDIPDSKVRELIDSAREAWEIAPDGDLPLVDVVNEAIKKNVLTLPSGWQLHPDVDGSSLSVSECKPRKKHWGDFVV